MSLRRTGTFQLATLFMGLFLWTLLLAPEAYSIPYVGIGTYTYHQPDGSTFEVKLYGDEFFAYQRTVDGQEVVRDDKTGFWCFASLAPDGRSFVSTGIPVVTAQAGAAAANRAQAAAAGAAAAGQTLPPDVVMARVRASQALHRRDDKGRPLPPEPAPGQKQEAAAAAGPQQGPPSTQTVGTRVGLCLLVDFSDQAGTIPQAQVDNFCNQISGYTGFNNACSVNEFYRIQSNGKLNFVNIVTAYVRVPKPKTYYDDSSAQNWGSSKAQELVATALDGLIAQGFDFTPLSRNGSGYITSINLFYAGTCQSAWATGIWPHSWVIPTKVVDATHGIYAANYEMSDMKSALEIGTFCHENGHMTCGYPDLYSYVNSASIVGYYTLMSSGCWGGGDGSHPNSIDPYLKYKSGWADVVEVTASTHMRATTQADRNYFYKYTNPANSQEYFLIENRNNTGYEGVYGGSPLSVAPGRGLVVWQVYEAGDNTYSSIQSPGNYTIPYEAMIVEATPTGSYSPWYKNPTPAADSSDTYYSGRGANPLNDASSPDLHFWDHTVTAGGRTVSSGLVLGSYGVQGPSVSFTIGAGAVGGSAIGLTATQIAANCNQGQSPANQTFNVFNAGGGTLNYSISDNAAWLSCSPTSGALTTNPQAITVSFSASGLAPGVYPATITVSDAGASNSPQTIPVTLTVANTPVLTVGPASIAVALLSGSTLNTKSVSIANTGGGSMNYTVTKTASWLTPSLTSGSCSSETDLAYLQISAVGLAGGIYNDTVTVTAPGATNSPRTVPVTLTVHDGVFLQAPVGGETWFTSMTQTVKWTTSVATNVRIELWKGGVLNRTVAASVANTGAYDWKLPGNLVTGSDYRIRIVTTDNLYSDQSAADFTIQRSIYAADMNANPGWTLTGQWAWGTPTGGAGDHGNPDPTSGYMGTKVMGYNLAGGYANSIASTYWATTPVFDCTNYTGVHLTFYRWLGVEQNGYDHAYLDANNNGGPWTIVWQNGSSTLDDGAWVKCDYDISAVADGKSNVQLRWGMGLTDSSWNYCGWNIDDVVVYGNVSAAPTTYTVTFQTDGTLGASLTGNLSQVVSSGSPCTPVGVVVPTGYSFVNWTLGGVPYSTNNPLTVSSVAQNMTLVAHFAINTYTLAYTAGANGSISGTTPQTVNYGVSGTTVTAVANTGYHFVQWSDASVMNPRRDANVTANHSVTASFAINTYSLAYTAGVNGSISGTTPQTINYGTNGTAVTATPAMGYHFVQWSDGVLTASRTDTNVTANLSVTACFAINTYTLAYTAGANGSVTGTRPQTVNYGASGTTVTAVASIGYHFVQWSDASIANPRRDANVTANHNVTASFAINTYTLAYAPGANGSVTGTTPQTVNFGASGTTVTAMASAGYHFVQWSDASAANLRRDTNVTANHNVTASFAINTYTLAYAAGVNGSVIGTTPQTVNYGASCTTVTAVASTGFHFVQWSDGSTANPRRDTDVTTNHNVTASFAINTYTVAFKTDGTSGASLVGSVTQVVPYGNAAAPVSAVPPVRYIFDKWTRGGTTYATANPVTVTAVTADTTITAVFLPVMAPAAARNWMLYR